MEADAHLTDATDAYNRRTTDYGNGRMEIVAYRRPRIRHTGTRLIRFPSGQKPDPTDEEQEERTKKQLHDIRRRIKGYALANEFRWFVTLTYNPEKVNSHDYGTAKTVLLKWCRRIRDRYGRFDYLLVPELHKSGAVHFHGLLGDIPADFTEAVNPKNGSPLVRHGRQVYNLTDWDCGYSDCEPIDDPERAASYITKYITSALLTDKDMYHKKRYFNSQGLIKPPILLGMADNTELDAFTPNFGIVETAPDGTNFLGLGIYNLTTDKETGELVQTDTGSLIIAKPVTSNRNTNRKKGMSE